MPGSEHPARTRKPHRGGRTFAPPPTPESVTVPKRILAGVWVVWSFWLVFRPVSLAGNVKLTPEARRAYAIVGFAVVFVIAWGLFGRSRWPVTASRALVVALILGVLPGPAGRATWVFWIDIVFAVVTFAIAYVFIRIGARPLAEPRRTDSAFKAREERARSRRERR